MSENAEREYTPQIGDTAYFWVERKGIGPCRERARITFIDSKGMAELEAPVNMHYVQPVADLFVPCWQPLYEDFTVVALCIQPKGSEHSHHDLTASAAITAGLAERLR